MSKLSLFWALIVYVSCCYSHTSVSESSIFRARVTTQCVCVCERGGRLRKLTLLECPLQSEDFGVGCVFMGAFWQEEAETRSRITEQQWNAVQQGISWVKHKAVLGFEEEHFVAVLFYFFGVIFILRQMTPTAPLSCCGRQRYVDACDRFSFDSFFISHHS